MSALASLYNNSALIGQKVNKEVLWRYKGSILGLFWSFVNPLTILAVYNFVFSFVFNARWSKELVRSADLLYNTTDYCVPEIERCIVWNDPYFVIAWTPSEESQLSRKDQQGVLLKNEEVFT